ncbi:hypothetical protein WJ36_13955 [Burkholderia ubonensis]|uniref:MNIO family bufferin maturase n=1 Tax=Burkholderia ubonensis TaxID=101571 RepID=UPI000754D64D|nr:DUF692 domain-containing protein [Burkholderia ubonensis]KVG81695.1 hypothetical protein WJ36_13955 [Burkholderia ubonensis]
MNQQPQLGAGLGLRGPHVAGILTARPSVGWWEVHSENYFGGGEPVAALERVREYYEVSLHGVGMGLGSHGAPDAQHLQRLKSLVARIEPALISEHLCWNRAAGRYFNDLLPVPRVDGALALVAAHIDGVQEALGRRILIENVSAYVAFEGETYSEAEMLAELVARTGCGVLLDVNNLYVNALNLKTDPLAEIARLPIYCIGEIHVAGFEWLDDIAIDTHGASVCDDVWTLLDAALARFGPTPVLLERDTHLPSLDALVGEYRQLETHVGKARERAMAQSLTLEAY